MRLSMPVTIDGHVRKSSDGDIGGLQKLLQCRRQLLAHRDISLRRIICVAIGT